MIRAVPGEVVVDVLTYAPWVPFAILMSFLCACVYSLSNGIPVSINLPAYNLTKGQVTSFILPGVPVCVRVKQPSASATNWLSSNDFNEIELRGKMSFLCDTPSHDDLSYLSGTEVDFEVEEKCFAPTGSLNLAAWCDLREINYLISCISGVLSLYAHFDEDPQWSDRSSTTHKSLAYVSPVRIQFLTSESLQRR